LEDSSVKNIRAMDIRAALCDAVGEIFCQPHSQSLELLRQALERESDETARDMLSALIKNAELAARERIPACQDTGLLIVFAELGTDVLITGGTLREIMDEAARAAWKQFWLRDSLNPRPVLGPGADGFPDSVSSHLILHLDQVPGDALTLHVALKGGGAENCSALRMFLPTAAQCEIEDFIVHTVTSADGRPCPPVSVGVGIGGNFETCAILAKQALFLPRDPGDEVPRIRDWEQSILDRINREGSGVQGMGGQTTALAVRILIRSCHIASLPVAVNLDCHCHRHTTRVL